MGSFHNATTPLSMLADAKLLLAPAMSPARQRTIISRVYYAAYTASLLHCPVKYDPEIHMGNHAQLLDALRKSEKPVLRRVHPLLKQLNSRRRLADYDMGGFITANMVRDAIEVAEEIILECFEMKEEITAEAG